MRTIFITGGAGFIGSALVRLLLAKTGYAVLNIDKLTYAANPASLADVEDSGRYRFELADICDASRMRALFAHHQPCGVIHLAAESHVDRSIDAPDAFIQTNVVGTFTLLSESLAFWRTSNEADRAAFRFVHVSTDEVYGSLPATGVFTEQTAYDPRSPYAASKAAADHLARAWHHTYGLPVITTNSSNNYGPCQFPEKLIPLAILSALANKRVPVYGNGEQVRDWLFVDDHATALLRVFERGAPGRTYNIGGRSERRNIDVVRAVCALLDEMAPDPGMASHERLITHVADRPGHDLRYAIDASRIEQELGWHASVNFETGLRATVQWYLSNPGWVERARAGSYQGQRLGLGSREMAQ